MSPLRKLSPTEFGVVRGLADGLADQGMALSVLDGVRPGTVLVDDPNRPTSLMIGAPEGGFGWIYLAGDPKNDGFRTELNGWLFRERGLGESLGFAFLTCGSDAWKDVLPEVLAPRTVIPDRRLHYACTTTPGPWRDTVPPGYRIEDVDRALLDSDVEIHSPVSDWLTANFGSAEQFLEHGVGAVAVHEGRTVAWILADSFVGGLCDIGGETEEAHRRNGLAYAATCRTIELAFERGVERIGWHCHAINLPSIRTAEKAGFEFRREYFVYPIYFDPEKHEGLVPVIAGEYREAAEAALTRGDRAEADRLRALLLGFADPTQARR